MFTCHVRQNSRIAIYLPILYPNPYQLHTFPIIACGIQHSAIIAHILMPETQQSTVVIIFII